jgi:hypothetical protein
MDKRRSRVSALALLVLVVLFGSLVLSSSAAHFKHLKQTEDQSAKLFAGYPKSPALESIIYAHRNLQWVKQSGLIFYATWFPGGNPRVADQCMVTEKGKVSAHRWVYDWAVQGGYYVQLRDSQLESLKHSVESLPESTQTPPLPDLIIVSFRNGEKWESLTYDRKKSADQVKDAYQLSGCPSWDENQ